MHDGIDIFDPALYAAQRLPVNAPGARGLHPWCYTSDAWFEREMERLFRRGWVFVGRAERVANVGDYVTETVGGVPVIIVRGRDGEVRAMANSCRHRGAMLLEGEGNCRGIKCPYHGWVYGIDGKLTGAPGMERADGFDKAENGLIPVRLEQWRGFMFLSFDPATGPLSDWIGDLDGMLAPYRLEDMVATYREEYRLPINWKVQVENFLEYYHTPFVHSASVYRQPVGFLGQQASGMVALPIEAGEGEHIAFFMGHEGTRALLQGDTGFPHMPQLAGHRHANGTFSGCVLPCLMMSFHQDCMWFLEIYPLGPRDTRIVQVGCFPKAATERPDFEEVSQRYIKRWRLVTGEDLALLGHVQKGLEGPLAVAGPVCHVEDKIHAIRQRWLARMLDNA